MNIAGQLERAAQRTPQKAALRGADGDLAFRQLDERAAAVAARLDALGQVKGDRIGVLAGSNTQFVAALYGIWKLGGIAVLLNPQLTHDDLESQMRAVGAGILITDDDPARQLAGAQLVHSVGVRLLGQVDPAGSSFAAITLAEDDLAVIAFTSGTTGAAKAAAHTHHAMRTQIEIVGVHFSASADDEILSLLPLYLFSIFLVGPMLAISRGATCRILPRYDAVDVAATFERDRTTIAAAVPLLFYDLLSLAEEQGRTFDLTSLRVVTCGGAPLSERVRNEFERQYGFRIVQLYGMTEGPGILTSDPMHGDRKRGSVGKALPHIRISIVDDAGPSLPQGELGEVCASAVTTGPLAGRYRPMAGYWAMPHQSAEALKGGMFHTGDIGYLDDEGFLFLVDRKKDIIIRGGLNIYPREIELLILTDPRVAECAVVGRPDARYGEVPVAYVQLREGGSAFGDDLLQRTNDRLASSMRLDSVTVVKEFPRNSLGKILRRELARSATQGATS